MKQPSIGYHLWHASLAWQSAIARALEPHELTHVQFFVLGTLLWFGTSNRSPNQGELARASGLDPMMTSQVVRALQARGLVARRDDPDDSRAWRLALTARGKRAAVAGAAAVRAAEARVFAAIRDKPAFLAALQEVATAVSDVPIS
jgi:DNA-binding MarR family transcriptional regulator